MTRATAILRRLRTILAPLITNRIAGPGMNTPAPEHIFRRCNPVPLPG